EFVPRLGIVVALEPPAVDLGEDVVADSLEHWQSPVDGELLNADEIRLVQTTCRMIASTRILIRVDRRTRRCDRDDVRASSSLGTIVWNRCRSGPLGFGWNPIGYRARPDVGWFASVRFSARRA